jgi:hypothetical protein
MKKSFAIILYTATSNDKEIRNSNMSNQYVRVKNRSKKEGQEIKNNTDQNYVFVDEFLEESMKSSSIYETDEDVDYEYWSSSQNAHATLGISNSLHNKCMNLLHLPEKYHIIILDGGAYNYGLQQGWENLSVHNTRRANVVRVDHEAAVKRNLPIISTISVVVLPDGISVLLIVHEGIYNDTANHSLLSELQSRDFGVKIDSICHEHIGTQKMVIKDVGNSLVIPFEVLICMIHFKHRLPTTEEFSSLKQYHLKQGDTPWRPSSFSDQVMNKTAV